MRRDIKQFSLMMMLVAALMGTDLVFFSQADDWPEWRGSERRDGRSRETNLLEKWPEAGPRLTWKRSGIGGGFSGVAVADGKVFTLGDSPVATELHVLRESDGELIRGTKIGEPGSMGGFPGPRATPTVEGDYAYVLGQRGDLACIKISNGEVVWGVNLKNDLNGKMMSGWGYSESPLVDAGRVVVCPGGDDGLMVALDKRTGEAIWRTTGVKDKAAYSSIVVAEIAGKRQYVQLTSEHVLGVEPESGEVLWQAERKGKTAVIPTPVVMGDHVFVTSGYRIGCNLFQVERTGSGFSVEEVYASKDMINHHGGVVCQDGYVYGYSDGKGWTCMELLTGEVKWADKSIPKGSICYGDGKLYLRGESGPGLIALVKATPEAYTEISRFEQPDRSNKKSWPHPVIANGRLYIRDMDTLLCYDIAD